MIIFKDFFVNNLINLFRSFQWKIITITLFMGYLFGVFFYAAHQFIPRDKKQEILIIDEKKQKEFGAFTVKVATGIYVKNFLVFNVPENRFIFDALVWFEYQTADIMLETIGQFEFVGGQFVRKSLPDLKVVGDKTFATYDVRVDMKTDLFYGRFPFDDHKISIILINGMVTPSELFFFVDNTHFNLAPSLKISNWTIRDLNTDYGYTIAQLDPTEQKSMRDYPCPQALFTMDVKASGIRKMVAILVPLYLALLFGLLSLLMSLTNMVGRFSLATSGLTALLGYRFVIEKMIPEVGYSTITDKIYLLILALNFGIFVLQIFFAISEGVGRNVHSKIIHDNIFKRLHLLSGGFYCIFLLTAALCTTAFLFW